MKSNYTKKLFEMNKFFIISIFIVASFFFLENANAISGACSSHNGVNCSMGRQLNGKVYCNDGWTESMADYDFMVMCKNYQFNCNTSEWNNLSSKYGLEELFFKMQGIIDTPPFNQTLYNLLKSQHDQASTLAERECFAIGADRVSQQNYEKTQSDFYNNQIKAEQDKLAQLEQEKQKLTESYLNALKNLNTCPANSTLDSAGCRCNDGYVASGSVCVTYTQNCQTKYGVNSYGDKNSCTCMSGYVIYNNQCILGTEYCQLNYGDHTLVKMINGISHCDCDTGYAWNSNTTACIKIEVKPTIPLPTTKPAPQEISGSKKEIPKIAKPEEKLIVKNEPIKEDTLTPSISEKGSVPKEEIKEEPKSKLFFRIFESIKNFFLSIFK